jgi:predicted N-acetyltransferase YhbS
MSNIGALSKSEAKALENFLSAVFGEENRALAHSYIQAMFSDDFRRPHFLVCRDDSDKIVGTACVTEEFFTVDCFGISWVCVSDHSRNKGVGAELVTACIDYVQSIKQNCTVILATYPGQSKLYDRLGFEKGMKDHWGGEIMIKHLQ